MAIFGIYNDSQPFSKSVMLEIDGRAYTGVDKFASLLDMVYRDRLAYGGDLAPGWRLRVSLKFCEQNPSLPGSPDKITVKGDQPVRNIHTSDAVRFLKTVKKWYASGGEVVDSDEAQRRADICRECAFNVPIVGCGSCVTAAKFLTPKIPEGHIKNEHELQGCGVCGCYLKIKIWTPESLTGDNDGELNFPKHCWNH